MRHKKAQHRISDELDRGLSPKRKAELETHLASCSSCRAYRNGLMMIQSCAAADILARTEEDRCAGLDRLRNHLEAGLFPAGKTRNPARPVPGFFPWRPWAWAAGTSVLGAAAILFFLLTPPRPLQDVYAYSLGDPWSVIEYPLDADESVIRDFNDSIRTSLAEPLAEIPPEVIPLLDEHALFLENLSEEDLRLLNGEIALEITQEEI